MSKTRSASSSKLGTGANTSEDEDWSEGSSSSRSVRSLESYREEISSRKGWLKKKSTWSNWKDVFVVVQGGIFLEFKKEDSSKPTKALPLSDCTVQPAMNLTGVKGSFGIFKKGKGSSAPMYFKAETDGSLVQWVTAIKCHCADTDVEWQTDEMLEALGDAGIIAGPTGTIIDLNSAACKLLGYTRANIIGQNVTIMMPEAVARNHASYLQRYIETGEKRLIGKPRKFTIFRANGSEVSVQLCLGELPNPQTGEVRFLARMRTDIEEASSSAAMGAIDAAIDAALAAAKEEIAKSVSSNLQAISSVLDKYKAQSPNPLPEDDESTSSDPGGKEESEDTLQVSFNNVEVHDRISEGGGSGAVIYNCTVDGWACVMKEVHLASLKGDKIMTILNEITVLEKLPYHKNLVRYLFHRRLTGSIQIFMRLYHGTLHQEITRRQTQEKLFSAHEVARLAMDIVTGLSMLHTRKLLHRDLKSDNIFITFDSGRGIAYLTLGDFDSAKQISTDAVAHTVIGTPGYMAPEILLNQKYGFPADIFAFGMILYELLSLQRPFFEERNAFKISQMIIEGKRPIVPEALGPDYATLIKLQKKCVHAKPDRRPSLASCKSSLVKYILNSDSSFANL